LIRRRRRPTTGRRTTPPSGPRSPRRCQEVQHERDVVRDAALPRHEVQERGRPVRRDERDEEKRQERRVVPDSQRVATAFGRRRARRERGDAYVQPPAGHGPGLRYRNVRGVAKDTSVWKAARARRRSKSRDARVKKSENARGSDGFRRAELWKEAERGRWRVVASRVRHARDRGHAPSWRRRTYRGARFVSSPRARGVSRTRSVAARARTRRAFPAVDRTSHQPPAALPPARPRGARPIVASPRRPRP